MKTVAIIQARVGSTRLPGKVLLPFGKTTVLGSVVSRARKAKRVDEVVVATSMEGEDDKIEDYCKANSILCFRGEEENVLQRLVLCARSRKADLVVRITADEPFLMADVVDVAIEKYQSNNHDIVSTGYFPAVPKGLDVEVFSLKFLEHLFSEAQTKEEREHVTYQAYREQGYSISGIRECVPEEDRRPEISLTVDTKEEYLILSELATQVEADRDLHRFLEQFDKHRKFYYGPQSKPIRIACAITASERYGMGHLRSLLTLLSALREEFQCEQRVYLPKDVGTEAALEKLHEKGIPAELVESGKVADMLLSAKPDAVLVDMDSRHVPNEDMALIARSFPLIYFDHTGFEGFTPAMAFNRSVLPAPSTVPRSCRYYTGPSFFLLDEKLAMAKKRQSAKVRRILVTMGGSDPNGLTEQTVAVLRKLQDVEIKVIIGPFNKRDSLTKAAEEKNFTIIRDCDNLLPHMAWSDVTVCTGGRTVYEALAVGTATLVVPQNKMEEETGKEFERRGATLLVNEMEKLAEIVVGLTLAKREEMARKGRGLVDWQGASRTAIRIASFLAGKSRKSI